MVDESVRNHQGRFEQLGTCVKGNGKSQISPVTTTEPLQHQKRSISDLVMVVSIPLFPVFLCFLPNNFCSAAQG